MTNNPAYLHFMARLLYGVEEADRARASGSVVYALMLDAVRDQHRTWWAARKAEQS